MMAQCSFSKLNNYPLYIKSTLFLVYLEVVFCVCRARSESPYAKCSTVHPGNKNNSH